MNRHPVVVAAQAIAIVETRTITTIAVSAVDAGAVAIGVGYGLDRLFGEPPTSIHPVARFGSVMSALEARIHADDRRCGIAYTATGVAIAAGTASALRRTLGPSPALAVSCAVAMAGSMLESEARSVAAALVDHDLPTARVRLSRLVGRSTAELDAVEISRAVIESVAENTVDAVTATIWWASIGGSAGVLMHRAINTMDAMVGHRTPRHRRFGWASARLDDMANWVPARLTAAAVVLAAPSRARTILRIVRRDARRHPSPNGGVVEAAFAAALDVRLGGTNRYGDIVENRGALGDGPAPTVDDIERAVVLARHVGIVVLVASTMMRRAVVGSFRMRWNRCGGFAP